MESTVINQVIKNCKEDYRKLRFVYEDLENQKTFSLNGKELLRKIQYVGSNLQKFTESNINRVLIILPQSMQFIYSILGAWYANKEVVLSPVANRKLSSIDIEKIEYIVSVSKPDKIITTYYLMKQARNKLKNLKIKFLLIEELEKKSLILPLKRQYTNDLGMIAFTSGSTSKPKGVMLTNRNIREQASAKEWHINKKSIIVSWLPQTHAFGLFNNVLVPAVNNATSIICSPEYFVKKPISWFELLNKYKATNTACLNFSLDYCSKKIVLENSSKLDLKNLEVITCAGEPVRKESYDRFEEKFKELNISSNIFCPLYGMTEVCPITSVSPRSKTTYLNLNLKSINNNIVQVLEDSSIGRTISSVGHLSKDVDIKIVNPHTYKMCNEKEIGMICIFSERVASAYYNDKYKIEKLCNVKLEGTRNRYFASNDLGFIYKNELFIVGRSNEMMIIRGQNYYPEDVEWAIKDKLSKLNTIIVFSIDKDQSEKLVVIIEEEKELNNKEINRQLRMILTHRFRIKAYKIFFVCKNTLTRTKSGKLERAKIKNNFLNDKLFIKNQY